MKSRNPSVLKLTQGAAIAALYVVLTLIFAPISFGEMQVRISEALTILPLFTPAAIPGLFVGCILGNLLGGAIPLDIGFGSLATLIGAVGGYLLRKNRWLVPLPTVLANALIVPYVLRYGYGVALPIPLMMGYVALGEIISCYGLGERSAPFCCGTGTSSAPGRTKSKPTHTLWEGNPSWAEKPCRPTPAASRLSTANGGTLPSPTSPSRTPISSSPSARRPSLDSIRPQKA